MLPSLMELKAKRKQFNLTQSQLAQLSGVSQSLIAKIESEAVVPSYGNAKRLFDALEKLQEQHSITAKEIMKQHVFFVRDTDNAKRAVALMEKNAISQLPVLSSNGACVGSLKEETILKRLSNSSGAVDLSSLEVAEIMDEAFPSVQQDTPISVLQSVLEHNAAVVVSVKGKIKGIVTKADLLKAVIKKL